MKSYVGIVFIVMSLFFSGCTWFQKDKQPLFSGQIETKNGYLGSKIAGRVEKIYKKEGDFVVALEPIVAFDCEETKLKEAQLKARMEQSSINLSKMYHGYQKEDVAVAKADLDAKNAALENALKNYERHGKLLKEKATTLQDYEAFKALFLQAKAQKEAAVKKLEFYSSGYRAEDVQMAEELLKESQANYALALLDIKECLIRSSTAGKIEKIAVQVGDLVAKNQAIIEISNQEDKYAKFYVPETLLHKISLGQKVIIRMDGSDLKADGEVFFIAQNAEFTPKNISTQEDRQNLLFAIKAKVNDDKLKSGMFIEVSLP